MLPNRLLDRHAGTRRSRRRKSPRYASRLSTRESLVIRQPGGLGHHAISGTPEWLRGPRLVKRSRRTNTTNLFHHRGRIEAYRFWPRARFRSSTRTFQQDYPSVRAARRKNFRGACLSRALSEIRIGRCRLTCAIAQGSLACMPCSGPLGLHNNQAGKPAI